MREDPAVALVAPNPAHWEQRFEALRDRVLSILPDAIVEHIGSTAVAGMFAKDVVDVLVGVAADELSTAVTTLSDDGLDLEGHRPHHAWLSLPSRSDRTAIVHVVALDSAQWRDRLDFRDLLRSSPGARESHLAVKRSLADGETGWGRYTAGKARIVQDLLDEYRAGKTISSSA
ncbi:GrpB family protein [Microbacterium sp. ARD32]|uniref:GrpB family protein n=1 Tax=Microbacterium sp. ARD32 TaxID=2962577 RepID=UPI0028823FCF|nr:GrpB family protein [Microbacterium sp. ARD32]MDT0157148.1 GrpB family protein [Microbacterium sp. ARD32]